MGPTGRVKVANGKPNIDLVPGSPEAQEAARYARELMVARIDSLRNDPEASEESFRVFLRSFGDVVNDYFGSTQDVQTLLNRAGNLAAAQALLSAYAVVALANTNEDVREFGRGADWALELMQNIIQAMDSEGHTI
jgi:hypothetical protein